MDKILPLKNPVQEYAWGSKTEIQNIIGGSGSSGKPMAELWMGAHPKAPSKAFIDGHWEPLNKVINKDPAAILGKNTAERFFGHLPFLFKILAADRPLSVQVHPNREQAKEGFARENDLKIPINAPNRNYKDANHKPEILCALTPFEGLKGFRKIEEILELMEGLSVKILSHELDRLQKNPNSSGLKSFFTTLMRMDKAQQKKLTIEALANAEKLADKDAAYHWIIELNREYPGDMGILSPLILNHVMLAPGEAIYLPAGELHAYLHGLAIELMANSDNVLRGGLTPKHMDVQELLNIVNFKTGSVRKVKSTGIDACRTIYEVPAEEFLLSLISVDEKNAFTSTSERSVEILICLEGKAEVENLGENEILPLARGQSILIPSQTSRYRIVGNAKFYMASVP